MRHACWQLLRRIASGMAGAAPGARGWSQRTYDPQQGLHQHHHGDEAAVVACRLLQAAAGCCRLVLLLAHLEQHSMDGLIMNDAAASDYLLEAEPAMHAVQGMQHPVLLAVPLNQVLLAAPHAQVGCSRDSQWWRWRHQLLT